ncbi:MAG: glycosyltransferase family 2 protein [Patescibacteria group bacterium]
MKISIIIPCYNEEASIARVIRSIPKTKEFFEVVVIDNNSTDRTAEIAEKNGARVVREKKIGVGAAIKKGFTVAGGDVLAVIDGDGQHPVDQIIPMMRLLETLNVDFVVGSRFPLKDMTMRPLRLIGNHFFNIAIRIIFGIKLSDSQSGMWVFRKEVLNHIAVANEGFSMPQEIQIRAATHPLLYFAEHHIVCAERVGVSKLSPVKDGFKNLIALFKLKKEFYKNDI